MNVLEINSVSSIIERILGSPVGSFSFVFGIMILAGWLIYFVTKKITEITVTHSYFVKRLDKVETNIDVIRMDISEMKGTLRLVTDYITKNDALMKKRSPLSLTEEGIKTVEDNQLSIMIEDNWGKINAALHNLKADNPYDIQEFCFNTAFTDTLHDRPLKFFTEKDIDKLKKLSYKSGISLFIITRMLGILIRDRYFKENEIDMEEIDDHDPDFKLGIVDNSENR